MINPVLQALRGELQSPAKTGRKLNILCMPTHEGYQSMLANTGHNFYMLKDLTKNWDYHTRQLPLNHYLIKLHEGSYRFDIGIDLVLSQERLTQLPFLTNIARQIKVPIVHLEHTEPRPEWTPKQRQRMDSIRADKHIYITEFNKNSWNDPAGTVIYHGIDTELFKPLGLAREKCGVSVVNLFPQRDVFCGWELWRKIAEQVPMKLYGYNPGLSESINNPVVLNEKLNQCSFFLNTSQLSPIPLSLLEAAAAGMPIVTTANQDVPKVFEHNVNCLMSNNHEELIGYCKELLANKELADRLGQNARSMIEIRYSMELFVDNWNRTFMEMV